MRNELGVVVGFDGSPSSTAALRFAIEAAHLQKAPLKVMIAYREHDAEEVHVHAQGRAWEELAVSRTGYPDLEAELELVDEPARPALLEAGEKARLLVVGPRGMSEIRGLLLGSVSQAMVHQAPCPVAVVHRP